MTRERWMALAFALGSLCFAVAPIGAYSRLVGAQADAATYFAGSVPFTVGGALQTLIAWRDRRSAQAGPPLVWSAAVQSIGTVYFNLTTARALWLTPMSAHYDRLVWRPDAFGSIGFLISGAIAYWASPRRGVRPLVDGPGWWQPSINLLGCVLFGVSAIAGYSAARGSLIGPQISDWNTALGAVCFLWCALATLLDGDTFKSPRLRRWEREIEIDVEATIGLR